MSRLGLGGSHLAGAHAAVGGHAGHGPLDHTQVRGGESTESWCTQGRGWRFRPLRGLHQLRIHSLKFLSVPHKFNKQSVFVLIIWERSLSRNVFNLQEKEIQTCMIKTKYRQNRGSRTSLFTTLSVLSVPQKKNKNNKTIPVFS